MLIKRDGVALAHAEIMRIVGSNGCITISAKDADAPGYSGIVVTLLQEEVIELARAYDLMLSEAATA